MILYKNEDGKSITFHSPQDTNGLELDAIIVSIDDKQINSIVTPGTMPIGANIYEQVEVFISINDMVKSGLYNLYIIIKDKDVVLLKNLVRVCEK